MNARELEGEQTELRRKRRRAFEAGLLAVILGLVSIALVPLSARLALALGIASALEWAIAAITLYAHRERIARLALDGSAYVIPEVERYGRRCVAQHERESLAAWIAEMLAEAHRPGNVYLSDRVSHFADDLEHLARELKSSAVKVQPTSVVACKRLLTHAVESPLYNPRVPPDELGAILRRIRGGIRVSQVTEASPLSTG
jgi:hypothetical protein